MKDFASEIDRTLTEHENWKPCPRHSMEWVSNRIGWCWKFKHITREQMESFCDRATEIFKRGYVK